MRLTNLSGRDGFSKATLGALLLALLFAVQVDASPIILQQANQFCDARSVNDVNFGVGRFLTLTGDLTPDGDVSARSPNTR